MKLTLVTPAERLVDQTVQKIIAEGTHGNFCLLPQHVDFLAVLVPGLLAWIDDSGSEHFAAVSDAVLVKQGDVVRVSAAQASRASDLETLRSIVREEFALLSDRQRAAHAATAKLEASFLRRTMDFADEQDQIARSLR